MARTLTFKRGIGTFKIGETYDVENNTTAQYFIDNAFATEEIVDEGCVSCKSAEIAEASPEQAKEKKPKKK